MNLPDARRLPDQIRGRLARGHAHINDFNGGRRVVMAILALMRIEECTPQPIGVRQRFALRDGDRQLEILSNVSHIERSVLRARGPQRVALLEPLGGSFRQLATNGRSRRQISLNGGAAASNEALLQNGCGDALRAQDSWSGWNEDGADADLARELDGMQTTGSAKRHQREVPRVVAALDRYYADGAYHIGVDDADDAEGCLAQAKAQPLRQRRHGRFGARSVEAHVSADECIGQPAQNEIGIRYRGVGATVAVTGRPRDGASAHRSDAHEPILCDVGNRSAACAYRVDIE